jgi:hypothetical protein
MKLFAPVAFVLLTSAPAFANAGVGPVPAPDLASAYPAVIGVIGAYVLARLFIHSRMAAIRAKK